MSKEHITPEVGDVWIYAEDKEKYLLVKEDRKEDMFDGWLDGILGVREDFKKTWWFRKDKFPQVAAYLGKSKANINDLFKTENE